jgi:DNA end-binding protein Ku
MAARAIWKGVVRFDALRVPVKLYSAIEDRGVHFRLLHRKDEEPVRQVLVNAETNELVSYDQTRRAQVTDAGDMVLLDKEELESLKPEPSRDIDILAFLPRGEIDHRWFYRPYYLGPDGSTSNYFALTDALQAMDVEGLARWAMRKKAYVGALRLYSGYPMLVSLRHAEEVVPADALEPPRGSDLDSRELMMARQLVEMLEADFEPQNYRDEYRHRVLEMVEAKAAGRKVKPEKPRRRERSEDIGSALEASLARARKSA